MKMARYLILCLLITLVIAAPVFASGIQEPQAAAEGNIMTGDTIRESVIGEWYNPNQDVDETRSVYSIRFLDEPADNVGKGWKQGQYVRVVYGESGNVRPSYAPDFNGEHTSDFVWNVRTLNGGKDGGCVIIHTQDYNTDSADGFHYTYYKLFSNGDDSLYKMDLLPEGTDKEFYQETFTFNNGAIKIVNRISKAAAAVSLTKTHPDVPEGLIPEIMLTAYGADESALIKKFEGTWFYDVTEWTFNSDKTGLIDIPAMGTGDASQIKFTYIVKQNDSGVVTLFVSLDDGGMIIFRTEFGNESGGSVLLKPSNGDNIKLTRIFDISNTPLTSEIMKGAFSIFTMGDYLSDVVE